jgi:hypothetical protein
LRILAFEDQEQASGGLDELLQVQVKLGAPEFVPVTVKAVAVPEQVTLVSADFVKPGSAEQLDP